MIEVSDNLFVGDGSDCRQIDQKDWAIVHACKHPCHQNAVGYRGNLSPTHPNYLIKKVDNNLFLNMVDMALPLSPKFTHPIMKAAMDFIDENIKTKKVLVHCNQGQSRSPSIAMVYMVKKQEISNEYAHAIEEFRKKYPAYSPGSGIEVYLKNNWEDLIQF